MKRYSDVTRSTLFVNFKHNFHKENETFSLKKLKRFKEKSLKMEPFLSELPYHIYDWLIISLKDFCIVIRKWPTVLPSMMELRLCGETFENDFSRYAHQPFPDMNVVPQPNC